MYKEMLYSLSMKFQVELEIFKINLKIVFCVEHFHFFRIRKFNQEGTIEELINAFGYTSIY